VCVSIAIFIYLFVIIMLLLLLYYFYNERFLANAHLIILLSTSACWPEPMGRNFKLNKEAILVTKF